MKPAVLRVLNEDLDAASQYLDEGNYERLTIQANRMISEAAVWGDSPNLALAGLVLRLATSGAQEVAPPGQLLAYPQKQAVASLLKDLSLFLNKGADNPLAPWEALAKFHSSFWSDLRPKIEGKSYTDNPEFVEEVMVWGLQVVRKSWQLLAKPTGSPLQGVVNEMSRVTKAHGANAHQLAAFGLLQALTWYSEYADWQSRKQDETVDSEALISVLGPFVERVLAVIDKPSSDEQYADVAETAFNILRAWRTDFALYYDLYLQQQLEARQRIRFVPAARKPERAPKRAKKKGE